MEKLEKSAHNCLVNYMGIANHETLLVLCDYKTREVGMAMYDAGCKICAESYYLEIKERDIDGQEPPEEIVKIITSVDAAILATSKSLTHTAARRLATDAGVRIGTMPGICALTVGRCFQEDPNYIIEINAKLQQLLQNTDKISVSSSLGTNATFSSKGREIISSTGVHTQRGSWGNVPSGEVYFAPADSTVSGRLVIDGSVAEIGLLTENIIIDIEDSVIKSIDGGIEAITLSNMLTRHYDNGSKVVAELGIGTNRCAKMCGSILEDEKIAGTVHVAFGNNISMGGTNNAPIHIDCVMRSPRLEVDGNVLVDKGELLVK